MPLAANTSSALASAYGLAVVGTMLINSLVAAIVLRRNWDWPAWKTAAVIAPILIIEFALLAASSLKIAHGGWFSNKSMSVAWVWDHQVDDAAPRHCLD